MSCVTLRMIGQHTVDESWEGAAPGTYGMAPRVLLLFDELNLNPGSVPCSNLVFARSSGEGDLKNEIATLLDLCWPFHVHVIETVQPKVILCFAKPQGLMSGKRSEPTNSTMSSSEKTICAGEVRLIQTRRVFRSL